MAAPFEFRNDAVGERFRRILRGIESELGRLGRLIRLTDAGEVLDLAGKRLSYKGLSDRAR